MAEPPVAAGTVQETEMLPAAVPWPAEMLAGAPGTVVLTLGVMAVEASDAAPVPTALVAATVNV